MNIRMLLCLHILVAIHTGCCATAAEGDTEKSSSTATFAEVLQYVKAVPEAAQKLVRSDPDKGLDAVMMYLTDDCKDAALLVRRINAWIVTSIDYDYESLALGDYPPYDWQSVLRLSQAFCIGYANLFKACCDRSALECKVISGNTHPALRMRKQGKEEPLGRHAWNVVKINGQWEFVDVTWNDSPKGNVHENWLFVAPFIFISTHFPKDERWQLLQKPVPKDAFRFGVAYHPNGFVLQQGPDWSIVAIQKGQGQWYFNLPDPGPGYYYYVGLRGGQGLSSHSFSFMLQDGDNGHKRLDVRLPEPGRFSCTVYRLPRQKIKGVPMSTHRLFSYPLEAVTGHAMPFPRLYQDYAIQNTTLESPRDARLPIKEPIEFVASCDKKMYLLIDNKKRKSFIEGEDGKQRLTVSFDKVGMTVRLLCYLDKRTGASLAEFETVARQSE